MSAETHLLPYGSEQISFDLVRRPRATLSISVHPNLLTEVVAPLDAPLDKIFAKVKKRAQWIKKQQLFFRQFQPRTTERKYVSGETHLYLGRQYKISVVRHIQEGVKLFRGKIIIQTHNTSDTETNRRLLEDWYKRKAEIKFSERLKVSQDRFSDPSKFQPSSLITRHMKQRWGSMTPTGKLILNKSLIRASVDAIDYVITHELCHIAVNHHGPEFIELLERVMPDWDKRKLKLERQLA